MAEMQRPYAQGMYFFFSFDFLFWLLFGGPSFTAEPITQPIEDTGHRR